tara:strand:- start:19098 stop:19880 length:783 start_codon:yes stop_codon:yes gene_type:complete
MFISTISESKRSTFQQCKLKYRYKYVDYIPEQDKTNTGALHFGSYIHKIFEDGVNASTFNELNEIAGNLKENYSFQDSYIPKIEKCINNFLRFNASLEETVATELVYEVELGKDIKQNGVIDRVIKGKDGGYLIIDYKTSKREKNKVDLYQDMQMRGYTYAIHKMYNVPYSDIVAAHYYPITDTFVHVSYGVPQINAYLNTVRDEVWKIRKAKKIDLTPVQNDFCNWCAFKSICPEFTDPFTVGKRLEEIKQQKAEAKKL